MTLRRSALRLALLAAVAVAAVLPAAARAAEPSAVRPLEIADAVLAASFHVQGRPAFSADGAWLAYTVCDPRGKKVIPEDKHGSFATRGSAYLSMGCDVWVSPIAGGPPQNVTETKGNSWGPTWSPDGKFLSFYSDRGGKPQVWLRDWKSGQTRVLTDAATRTFLGFTVPVWTTDSRQVVIRMRPEGMTDEELEGDTPPPAAGADEKEPGSTVVVYRSEPPTKDAKSAPGAGVASRYICDLGLVDVATGRVKRIAERVPAMGAFASPDGTRLAYLVYKGRKDPASLSAELDLVLYDFATGASRVAATGVQQGFGTGVSWSPDGRRLAYFSGGGYDTADVFLLSASPGSKPRKLEGAKDIFSSDFLAPLWDASGRRLYLTGENRVWRADVETGRVSPLTPDLGKKVFEILQAGNGYAIWSPDGASLYVSRRDDETKKAVILRVNLDSGAAAPVLEEEKSLGRVFDTPLVSPDGKAVVYVSESASESEDLWVAGPDFRGARRLTHINPQFEKYTFGESRLIEFTNADGKRLHASLLLPAGYIEGRRYPTLVFVYPQDWGSETVFRFGLGGLSAYNLQMLATRGYAVLQPDVPVGKGTMMTDLMKSVGPAIDRAAELGIVDPDRLAVTGQSAGGYATIAILTQTPRFKAAIMNAGFGDLTAFYGAMSLSSGEGVWVPWLETLTGGMGAGPWDAPQTYVQNSPIYALNRVQTPLIIQAGGSDAAIVPYSDQVYSGLKRLGRDVTYLRYGGEGHVLAAQANLVDYWKRVMRFLDERLKAPAASPAAAAGAQ